MKTVIESIGNLTSDRLIPTHLHGSMNLGMALGTIFIAIFAILFIFDRIDNLSKQCETEVSDICQQLSGPSLPMITILLIVAGLIMVVLTITYILLSA